MGEIFKFVAHFFQSLRQRLGILTLLIALFFMQGWFRSFKVQDVFSLPAISPMTRVVSSEQCVFLVRYSGPKLETGNVWETFPNSTKSSFDDPMITWQMKWHGFGIGDHLNPGTDNRVTFWSVPYWFIVCPLTLLSMYLLLSRRPPSNEMQTIGHAVRGSPDPALVTDRRSPL